MKKSLFVLGMASMLALTGCHGLKKVEYSEFESKVKEACKETPEVKQVKIKGEYDGAKANLTYDIPKTAGSALDSLISGLTGTYNKAEAKGIEIALADKTPESFYTLSGKGNDNYTYYVAMGFKVETGSATYEWNSKGLLAKYKSESASFSFSWVKA